MATTLTIEASLGSNVVLITPNIPNPPANSKLQNVRILLNEISVLTGFVEKDIPFFDDEKNQNLTTYTLTAPDVVPGKSYLMKIRQFYQNNTTFEITTVESNVKEVTIQSVPVTPIANLSNIRAGDSGVSINLNSQYTRLSSSDGFSPITKMIVYIAKVNSQLASDFITETITINQYNNWYPISSELGNGVDYEIAFRLVNGIGESLLSNTFVFKPSDLPAEVNYLKAYNRFNDPLNPGVLTDNSGDLVLYWQKPNDYDLLAGQVVNNVTGALRVTSFEISKQELVLNSLNNYVASGSPEIVSLTVPAQGTPSFQITEASPEGLGAPKVHFKHIFPGSSATYGKIFRFTVFAKNANGSGPESRTSNNVASYANPDLQLFVLNHLTQQVPTIGTPVTSHTGGLKITVSSLSKLNGLSDIISEYTISGVTAGPTAVTKAFDRIMQLIVESDDAIPVPVFNGDVTLSQKYTTTTSTGANPVTTATLFDEWSVDLSTVTKQVAGVTKSIIELLTLGQKYRFTLIRKGCDPLAVATVLKSAGEVVTRTHFKSPLGVSAIEAYSINSDFTPVTLNSQPAIRVVFNKLTQSDLNGCDSFGTPIEYEVRSNSQSLEGVSRITHNSSNPDPLEFVVTSSLGQTNNLYIRVYVKNTELNNLEIQGSESSPAVSDQSVSYPLAVTNLSTRTTTSGGVGDLTVSWTRQPTSQQAFGGFSTNFLSNIVYLYNETTPTAPVVSTTSSYSSTVTDGLQSVTFGNLVVGNIYKVYVVATGSYTKAGLNPQPPFNDPPRFSNALVRRNFATTAATIVGTPGKPTNVEAYAGSTSVTFNYDSVVSSQLNGHNPENFQYNFILNSDSQNFPYQNSAANAPLQESVTTVSGTSEAIVTKGYTSRASSNNRNNAVDLLPQTPYNYAMYVVSQVGGTTILNKSDVLAANNGTQLSLVPLDSTPVRNVVGDVLLGTKLLWLDNNIPKPVIEASSGEGLITLLINKPPQAPHEMVVSLDNGDAIGANLQVIRNFDTRDVRDANPPLANTTTGLFTLESNISTYPVIGGINYGAGGYEFKVVPSAGGQRYSIVLRNLVNGRVHNVTVRFANTMLGYDVFGESTSVSIAAEAPPTVPQNVTFNVASKIINLAWDAPANSGGAGIGSNSSLLYEVQLLSSLASPIISFDNISTRSFQINATNYPQITDGTIYQIQIFAYYLKAGSKVVAQSNASIPSVRPQVPPLAPTVTSTRGNNSITVNITTAPSTTQSLYALLSTQVFVKKSTDIRYPDNPNHSIAGPFSGSNQLSPVVLTNLLNGLSYDVEVRSIPNYSYAQAPATQTISGIVPFGSPSVTVQGPVTGNNKAVTLLVNLNGSGSVTQLIGLGKSTSSNTIGIINLSGGSLPAITSSGMEGGGLAANQLATLIADFGATIPNALTDAIFVVNTTLGSDAVASGTHFTGP